MNFPNCIMAKVERSGLAAKNRLQVSEEKPSLKALLLIWKENSVNKAEGHFFLLDSLYFLQRQKFGVRISISV